LDVNVLIVTVRFYYGGDTAVFYRGLKMKRKKVFYGVCGFLMCVAINALGGCAGQTKGQTQGVVKQTPSVQMPPIQTGDPAKVYMTADISPAGLMAAYEALGLEASGKVAVKISTGEPGNTHYLAPDLIKGLVQRVDGAIVECNTAYSGRRASTAIHYQVAKDHGFTAIAPVVILDENGDIPLPVTGSTHLKEDYVGAHFSEYDFHIVLSHFKGHAMGGFGGALKNAIIYLHTH
jgi:uncharacterized Fe-S center protein